MKNDTLFEKYAIFESGGKQYQGIEGKTIALEKLDADAGATVEFDNVLFRKNKDGSFEIGTPHLKESVKASVVKHIKGPKVISFRFKRRKKVRVKRGHRQPLTVIRVDSIA